MEETIVNTEETSNPAVADLTDGSLEMDTLPENSNNQQTRSIQDIYKELFLSLGCRNQGVFFQKFEALEDKSLLNSFMMDDYNFLMQSIYTNNLPAFQILQQTGVDLKTTNQKGWSIAHVAAMHNRADMLELIMQLVPELSDALDENGNTPFVLAAMNNSNEACKVLIQNQVDLNAVNKDNDSAFSYCIKKNNIELASLIAEQENFFIRDEETVLTVENQNIDMLRLALNCGGNKNSTDKNRDTLLTLATKLENVEIVTELLARGADWHRLNGDALSAPLIAARQNNPVLKALFNKERIYNQRVFQNLKRLRNNQNTR